MSILKDLTLGQYLPADSVVHHLDPRTKLGSALALMAVLMFVKSLMGFLPLCVGIVGVIGLSGISYSVVLRNIRAFRWLLLLTFFAHSFLTPGTEITVRDTIIPWITHEGLNQGALFTGRLASIMVIAAILTLTTAPIEVADGLESLLSPFKRIGVPAHELAMMMVIALRFIPTLVDEAGRLQKAQMARGADFSGNPFRKAKKLTALLIPLMLSAFRRADDLAVAMDARCYRGGTGRTQYRELAFEPMDGLAALALVSVITACYLLIS